MKIFLNDQKLAYFMNHSHFQTGWPEMFKWSQVQASPRKVHCYVCPTSDSTIASGSHNPRQSPSRVATSKILIAITLSLRHAGGTWHIKVLQYLMAWLKQGLLQQSTAVLKSWHIEAQSTSEYCSAVLVVLAQADTTAKYYSIFCYMVRDWMRQRDTPIERET